MAPNERTFLGFGIFPPVTTNGMALVFAIIGRVANSWSATNTIFLHGNSVGVIFLGFQAYNPQPPPPALVSYPAATSRSIALRPDITAS